MTIDELIERLQGYRAELGGHTEVRLMTQQNWPFENGIVGLASTEEMAKAEDDPDEEYDPDDGDGEFIYIVEGARLATETKRHGRPRRSAQAETLAGRIRRASRRVGPVA